MLRREGMHFVLLFTLTACTAVAVGPVMNDAPPTVYDQIQNRSELSEFFELVTQNQLVSTILQFRQATVFAPNNEAMANYKGDKSRDLLLYHIANVALTTENLDRSVSSELPGNPPLWVSRRDVNEVTFDLYINDAKVISADIAATSSSGDRQILYVIDKVLEPIAQLVTESLPFLSNPDAAKFIERSSSFNLDEYRISDFVQLVKSQNKLDAFATPGRHTFLIPVNRGFEAISRAKVDGQVIDGHIVPNVVLFARTAINGRPVQTLSFKDDLKITVAFNNDTLPTNDQESRVYVQSNTLVGDYHHPRGVVVTHIVKANIPVRNGVIHLIEKPLVVIDSDIVNFLKEQRNGILYEFYRIMKDYAVSFMENITGSGELTLLAPSNEAFRRLGQANLDALLSNQKKLTEILQLHVIRRHLSSDEIVQNPNFSEQVSADRGRRLYFSANGQPGNMTITVEGNGVNATLIQPDIGALNGVVHIIDRVLGVPSMTVIEKIGSDPMMSKSFELASQGDWLKEMQRNRDLESSNYEKNGVTFLVPSNAAWDALARYMPSVHKKLFMGEFSYHANQVLNRHLSTIRGLTIEELTAPKAAPLKTISGLITIRSVNYNDNKTGEFYAEWDGIRARIIRPDVQCTDGVIHVIDKVLLLKGQISVNGQMGPAAIVNPILIAVLSLLCAFWN